MELVVVKVFVGVVIDEELNVTYIVFSVFYLEVYIWVVYVVWDVAGGKVLVYESFLDDVLVL